MTVCQPVYVPSTPVTIPHVICWSLKTSMLVNGTTRTMSWWSPESRARRSDQLDLGAGGRVDQQLRCLHHYFGHSYEAWCNSDLFNLDCRMTLTTLGWAHYLSDTVLDPVKSWLTRFSSYFEVVWNIRCARACVVGSWNVDRDRST